MKIITERVNCECGNCPEAQYISSLTIRADREDEAVLLETILDALHRTLINNGIKLIEQDVFKVDGGIQKAAHKN